MVRVAPHSDSSTTPRFVPDLSSGQEIQKLEEIDKSIAFQQRVNSLEIQKANLQQTVADLQSQRDDAFARIKVLESQAAKDHESIESLKTNIKDLESLNYSQNLKLTALEEIPTAKEEAMSKLKPKANKSSPNWSPAFIRKNFAEFGSSGSRKPAEGSESSIHE